MNELSDDERNAHYDTTQTSGQYKTCIIQAVYNRYNIIFGY